jgi:hypothetical protein
LEWRAGTRLKTGGHASLYGRPVSRTVPELYRIFSLTILYGFRPYRTVTVQYIRSENGDTAYKHSPAYKCVCVGGCVQVCMCAGAGVAFVRCLADKNPMY